LSKKIHVGFFRRWFLPALKKIKIDVRLTPGMPIDGFLITGSRTMLQYLITPISESSYKAFREK
jgi:hypothetical protein